MWGLRKVKNNVIFKHKNVMIYTIWNNKGGTGNMNVTVNDFNLKSNQIATVLTEQTFYIGNNACSVINQDFFVRKHRK